jgi:hypothetical protein
MCRPRLFAARPGQVQFAREAALALLRWATGVKDTCLPPAELARLPSAWRAGVLPPRVWGRLSDELAPPEDAVEALEDSVPSVDEVSVDEDVDSGGDGGAGSAGSAGSTDGPGCRAPVAAVAMGAAGGPLRGASGGVHSWDRKIQSPPVRSSSARAASSRTTSPSA